MSRRVGPEELARFEADARAALPDEDELLIQGCVCGDVMIYLLGREWADANLDVLNPAGFFGRPTEGEADAEAYLTQTRITLLAQGLLAAQHLEGFDEHLASIRTRDLRGVDLEIRAAVQLHEEGHRVVFRAPTGTKGGDYDLDVLVGEVWLAVEVKTREELGAADYRPGLVANTLRTARKQLPADGPSAIFVHIPWTWGNSQAIREEIVGETREWIRATGRVNRVDLWFEELVLLEGGGGGAIWRRFTVNNPSPKADLDLSSFARGPRMGNDPVHLAWTEDGGISISTTTDPSAS